MNRLAWLLATTGGLGHIPWAPGTAGSALSVLCLWILALCPANLYALGFWSVAVMGIPLGAWAAGRVEARSGRSDPGSVVVDEFVGQWLCFMWIPACAVVRHPVLLLGGFCLFRVLDIFKPLGIRKLERLGGGLGIMADDVLAGLYTSAVVFALFGLFGQCP